MGTYRRWSEGFPLTSRVLIRVKHERLFTYVQYQIYHEAKSMKRHILCPAFLASPRRILYNFE